jgi:hypothetical protein
VTEHATELTEHLTGPATGPGTRTGCAETGERTRLRWFYGQPVGAADLRREQAYYRDAIRRHNRLLHGWGIVCGLEVEVRPAAECDPALTDPAATTLVVSPGAAIDATGDDIVVGRPRPVELSRLLPEAVLEQLAKHPGTVYLSICFHEHPVDLMRPLTTGGCEPPADLEYARIRETYRICASLDRPDPGPRCEPCCGTGIPGCLELAAIVDFDPSRPTRPEQLRFRGRRALARHRLAQIRAINWVHGARYRRDDANALLAEGFEVWLSRPVQVTSLRPGAVDLVGVDAGAGRSAGMYVIAGEFTGLESGDLTDRFAYRSTTEETLQYGDRVIITVRGDFILDECCRALDGDHLGGAVPLIPETTRLPVAGAEAPPCPPRWSGNGAEGGDFVSWIYVQERGRR